MHNFVQHVCILNRWPDLSAQDVVLVNDLKFKRPAFRQHTLKLSAKSFNGFFNIVGFKPRCAFANLLDTTKPKNRFLELDATPSILL